MNLFVNGELPFPPFFPGQAMGMVWEMSLDKMYTPHTMAEEQEKGSKEQDKAMGWLGGARVELLDFVMGIDVQLTFMARQLVFSAL